MLRSGDLADGEALGTGEATDEHGDLVDGDGTGRDAGGDVGQELVVIDLELDVLAVDAAVLVGLSDGEARPR